MRLQRFGEWVNESWFVSKDVPEFEEMIELIFKPGTTDLRYPELLRDRIWPALVKEKKKRFDAKYPNVETLERELKEFKAKIDRPGDAFGGPEARIKNRFLTACVFMLVYAQCKYRTQSEEDLKKDRSNLCTPAYDYLIGEYGSVILGYMDLAADQWHWALSSI